MGDSTSLLRLSGFNFSQGMDIFLSQKICSCMVFPSYKQRCSLLTFLSQHPFLCLRATLETCLQIAPFAKGCDQIFRPLLIYGVGMECLSGSSACSGASRWLWIFWYMYPLRPRRLTTTTALLSFYCLAHFSKLSPLESCGSQSATTFCCTREYKGSWP